MGVTEEREGPSRAVSQGIIHSLLMTGISDVKDKRVKTL